MLKLAKGSFVEWSLNEMEGMIPHNIMFAEQLCMRNINIQWEPYEIYVFNFDTEKFEKLIGVGAFYYLDCFPTGTKSFIFVEADLPLGICRKTIHLDIAVGIGDVDGQPLYVGFIDIDYFDEHFPVMKNIE